MATRILLLFLILPALEIYLFLLVGEVLGLLNSVIILLVLSSIGGLILRIQGLRLLMEVQAMMARGELPAAALVEGVLLAVGGILLLTPGFLTDLLALALLLPLTRRPLGRWALTLLEKRLVVSSQPGPSDKGPTIIDV